MPTLPLAPQVLKFVVQGTIAGDPWANVLHWLYDGGPPVNGDCDHFAATLWTAWGAQFATFSDPDWSLTGVTAEDVGNASGAVGGFFSTVSGGEAAGHLASAQNCALISHKIARHYRGGHPRTYLAGISASILSSGRRWNTGFDAVLTGAWTSLQGAMDADTHGGVSLVGQVSVSYFDKALFPVPPHLRAVPVIDLIIGSVGSINIATQRRRAGR